MLTRREARRFYDRFGARQDSQAFYEDRALDELIRAADFASARRVVEFGCGTGRFAAGLLGDLLPASASYVGYDLSSTMVELARERLQSFGDRARVEPSDGSAELPLPDGACDRFVSNYVLDLLPEAEIRKVLAEAHRLLEPGGRICLTGLTTGAGPLSRMVMTVWRAIHRLRPSLVGGCRPIEVLRLLPATEWEVEHHTKVVAWGVPSEGLGGRSATL